MVVDDEEDILELVKVNLAREGFVIQTALTGEDTLRQAANTPIHLIVIDKSVKAAPKRSEFQLRSIARRTLLPRSTKP